MLAVKNGRIITDEGIIEGKNIIIENGLISKIVDYLPALAEVVDARGNFVSPGFIDIHTHGAGGYDTMDGSMNSINSISRIIAKHGVTSFLPTTMTASSDDIRNAVRAVRECMDNGTDGASVLGAHLEGPFINEKAKGAQNGRYVRIPDADLFMDIIGNDFTAIKRATIAPEIENASDLIGFMVGQGITVSLGHTLGTYDDIMNGISKGISHSTHLYNAMEGFGHREPGVVGAIFDSRITTEFIADGIHIHFAAIRTAIAVKGYQNCALITDSMQACCMEDGIYSLGKRKVFVKEGAARLKNGTLAGSTLTMDTAVKNVLKNTSLNIIEAVYMASAVPARIAKVTDTKGRIKQGYDADIIIFDPDINVKTTIINGQILK